jgi:hypothetical protein
MYRIALNLLRAENYCNNPEKYFLPVGNKYFQKHSHFVSLKALLNHKSPKLTRIRQFSPRTAIFQHPERLRKILNSCENYFLFEIILPTFTPSRGIERFFPELSFV